MVIDFGRSNTDAPLPVCINGEEVERVDAHRYLGIVIDNKFSFHQILMRL